MLRRTKRECVHGGDPWTKRHFELGTRNRYVTVTWARSLMGKRPCGIAGHAVHDDGGIVIGQQ